jgi:hypothetical protein
MEVSIKIFKGKCVAITDTYIVIRTAIDQHPIQVE